MRHKLSHNDVLCRPLNRPTSAAQYVVMSHHNSQLVMMSHHESQLVITGHHDSWIMMNHHGPWWVTISHNESQWVTMRVRWSLKIVGVRTLKNPDTKTVHLEKDRLLLLGSSAFNLDRLLWPWRIVCFRPYSNKRIISVLWVILMTITF